MAHDPGSPDTIAKRPTCIGYPQGCEQFLRYWQSGAVDLGSVTCLSQLPWDLPTGIHRSDYKNFCIACCEWDQDGPAVPCCTLSSEHLQKGIADPPLSCQSCVVPPMGRIGVPDGRDSSRHWDNTRPGASPLRLNRLAGTGNARSKTCQDCMRLPYAQHQTRGQFARETRQRQGTGKSRWYVFRHH